MTLLKAIHIDIKDNEAKAIKQHFEYFLEENKNKDLIEISNFVPYGGKIVSSISMSNVLIAYQKFLGFCNDHKFTDQPINFDDDFGVDDDYSQPPKFFRCEIDEALLIVHFLRQADLIAWDNLPQEPD